MLERENSRWLERACHSEFSNITGFAHDTRRLFEAGPEIKGHILIVGHGQAFPERAIVCAPDDFNELKPEIDYVMCCDFALSTNPFLWVNNEVRIIGHNERLQREKGVIDYSPTLLQTKLATIDDASYDLVFMFRISDMDEQLPGLKGGIRRILKKGGFFIGSGSFPSKEAAETELAKDFRVRQIEILANPSSGYPFKRHIGFKVKKED